MIDLGLFLADSFNQPARVLEDKLLALAAGPIQGGLVHSNAQLYVDPLRVSGFQASIDARQLGHADADVKSVRCVTYRGPVSAKPAALSPIIANCADRGATLFVHSPFTDGQSASPALAARAGLRQVNHPLAKALLTFLAEEATFYGASLHILGVSSAEECRLLAPFRDGSLRVSCSAPAYLLDRSRQAYGYEFEGRLSPSLIGSDQRQALLEAACDGEVDALTSHHYFFSEPLELDPLSAEQGASTLLSLPSALQQLKEALGAARYAELTEANPQRLLTHA